MPCKDPAKQRESVKRAVRKWQKAHPAEYRRRRRAYEMMKTEKWRQQLADRIRESADASSTRGFRTKRRIARELGTNVYMVNQVLDGRPRLVPEHKVRSMFKEWQEKNLLHCAAFPEGACCARCHADRLEMRLRDLPDGRVAHVCCSKELHNRQAVGLTEGEYWTARYEAHNFAHLSKREIREQHEIEELPEGIMRRWLLAGNR